MKMCRITSNLGETLKLATSVVSSYNLLVKHQQQIPTQILHIMQIIIQITINNTKYKQT